QKIKVALAPHIAGHFDVSHFPPQIMIDDGVRFNEKEMQEALASIGHYNISLSGEISNDISEKKSSSLRDLLPLFIIVTYIFTGVLLGAYIHDDYSLHSLMANFMGGFFIVFSLFKMINLSGFAEAFATYDVVAARSKIYSFSYPFIEIFLGVAYFLRIYPVFVNTITALLMFIGAIGVINALKTQKQFQCACLGTALKLPMTKVTLIEDLVMGVMAVVMITSY